MMHLVVDSEIPTGMYTYFKLGKYGYIGTHISDSIIADSDVT